VPTGRIYIGAFNGKLYCLEPDPALENRHHRRLRASGQRLQISFYDNTIEGVGSSPREIRAALEE
jgi:hypothetical protein